MATRKKTSKKSSASKKSAGKKSSKRPAIKRTPSRKSAKKKTLSKKTVARRKAPAKKTVTQKTGTQKTGTKTVASPGSKPSKPVKKGRADQQRLRSSPLSSPVSGLESGDLQGLSNVESADSESVDELLEEGNAFEAGIVSGVEESGDREGKEVRTRELPEDDVPEEYLDEQ
jgi:hypothetical protein